MRFAILALVSLLVVGPSSPLRAAEYKLYYLGGQSNMDGYGYNSQLPAELNQEVEGVRIFCGNPAPDFVKVDGRGLWAALAPGFGVGFTSDGQANKLSDRFGAELSFARELRKLDPQAKIAIIKYSRGGTAIDPEAPNASSFGCWEPDFAAGDGEGKGINQFDHFQAAVAAALAQKDIDGDGADDLLVPSGICWMQGESDAFTEPVARRYEANLEKLVGRIRTTLGEKDAEQDPQLPIVIGRIVDSGRAPDGKTMDFCELVQEEQAKFAAADPHAALINATKDYKFSDDWHYDTAAYIDLGQQFAQALEKLSEVERRTPLCGCMRCCPASIIDSRAACCDTCAR